MNRKRIALTLVVGVVATVAATSTASGSACPERVGHGCKYGGEDTGSAQPNNPSQQRSRLQPTASLDRNGQQVWRAGNHVMY